MPNTMAVLCETCWWWNVSWVHSCNSRTCVRWDEVLWLCAAQLESKPNNSVQLHLLPNVAVKVLWPFGLLHLQDNLQLIEDSSIPLLDKGGEGGGNMLYPCPPSLNLPRRCHQTEIISYKMRQTYMCIWQGTKVECSVAAQDIQAYTEHVWFLWYRDLVNYSHTVVLGSRRVRNL